MLIIFMYKIMQMAWGIVRKQDIEFEIGKAHNNLVHLDARRSRNRP